MPGRYYPRAGVILDVVLQGETTPRPLELRPRRVEIERNDHRTADTFSVELDYKDFPLDPRSIASARIRILLGDVGETQVASVANAGANIAFLGFVDVPETSLDESGEVVKLEGRDYTASFLDHRWGGGAIRIDRPLIDILGDILSEVPGADAGPGGLVLGFSEGASNVIPSTLIGKTKFSPQKNDDAWTLLTDLCGRLGLVPVIEFDMLLILEPSAVGVDRETFLASGAMAPNQIAVAYGENLKRLTFRRNFVEAASKQIQVTCWNAQTREVVEAKYPPAPIVVKRRVTASGKVKNDTSPMLPFYISGTYDIAAVTAIAKRIYDEAAREEIEGEFETMDMADPSGFALPRLGNGDQVLVTLGTGTIDAMLKMTASEAIAYLTARPRSMDPDVAQALVAAYNSAQVLTRAFHVKSARHTWSRDDGYSLACKFINYVVGVDP